MSGTEDRIKQIIRITWARLNGGLSHAEMMTQISRIKDPQEALPLGVGAATEEPK